LSHTLRGSEVLIREYLNEEVIDCLTAQVKSFLYDTACLERFCAEMCDAARDRHDSLEMLAYLQAKQVFLVPLEEQGHWLRY
ncbi:helix-turn-helix transcriptional regulator, partial [Pseudomonas syringae pv. tagetis]